MNDSACGFYLSVVSNNPSVFVNAVEYPMDPLAAFPSAVADVALNAGEFYTGLTRDDVGGLRYLLQTNNGNLEILAAETKDLPRLDSYHWYGPHFTKFAGTGQRLDAAAAREGEHKGLSALVGLKLRPEDLQIEVFNDAAVATFTMVATIQSGAEAITKRERGTLVFVKHEGSWKIVHEHFSAAE